MPIFKFKGIAPDGTEEEGSIESSSEALAYKTLVSRGVTVYELRAGTSLHSSGTPWYHRDISFWNQELPHDQQAVVAELLSCLFASGVTASEVIRISALASDRNDVKRQLERTGQLISDGKGIGEAFEIENKLFSPIFTSFLKISDATNTLPAMMRELSSYFRKQHNARKKVISALIYPAILLLAAASLLLVVIFYLAPNLEPIFNAVGNEPPATIRALLQLNSIVSHFWAVILAVTAFFPFALIFLLQLPKFQTFAAKLKYKLPLFGPLFLKSDLVRLSYTTKMLLDAGDPLSKALRTSSASFSVPSPIVESFKESANAIEMGSEATSVFMENDLLPVTFKELFKVGERSNSLPRTLQGIIENLNSEIDTHTQRLLSLLTPILTLVFGLGIGFLIYSLMGAILEVNEVAF